MTYPTQSVVPTKLRKPSNSNVTHLPKVSVEKRKNGERVLITLDVWSFPMENGRYCTSGILRGICREMVAKGFKEQARKLHEVIDVASSLEHGTLQEAQEIHRYVDEKPPLGELCLFATYRTHYLKHNVVNEWVLGTLKYDPTTGTTRIVLADGTTEFTVVPSTVWARLPKLPT